MASERFLAEHRGAFWQTVLPRLSTRYARIAGKSARLPLQDYASPNWGSWKSEARYNDLIGETGFFATARIFTHSSDENVDIEPEDQAMAIKSLKTVTGKSFEKSPIPEFVWADAKEIASRLINLLKDETRPLAFHPTLKGLGILDACHPDLIAGSTLIEIKTSKDGFREEDFRQLFIYGFLANRNGLEIHQLCLLNPRTAQRIYLSHDELCQSLGGESATAVYGRFERLILR